MKILVQSYHAYIVFESNKDATMAVKELTAKGLQVKITEQNPGEYFLRCFHFRSIFSPCEVNHFS